MTVTSIGAGCGRRTCHSGVTVFNPTGSTQSSRLRSAGGMTPGSSARAVTLKDGRTLGLRLARSEDACGVQRFVQGLSERSRRNRFFTPVRELSSDQLERMTRSHPPGELALVVETSEATESRIVAMAQYVVCETLDAEFAVVVDDTWQRQGLGILLVGVLAEQAARAGLKAFAGLVLADNWPMLALLTRLDCELVPDRDPYIVRVFKRLDAHHPAV